MSKFHKVENLTFKDDTMVLKIDDVEYSFNLQNVSELLLHASKSEREHFEISSSGYGIHWSLLDEDLSIDGILGISHNPPNPIKEKSFA
ncbi:MAG: DUF2442 domain-containing protein [Ignavibacteria bacterium CG_4_8_14_3_um_filter_37_9]|nr:DUF2442 domain-containing protein [Ignavibacteria bacterium]OIO16473.1 MAG: hypothetical protein AUJ54_11355 [Ignavibacteria bacterium CG1_02_37_35]PIP76222.1 MAG: hypothetical protein COW85_15375 [Ignavibacteria bacterium CG22_combo_CG10-13_8_21_14_all_37_15]PIS45598.1 MAG: DUF2442 domain-containing protein [Ignavibacteria bacterium CG08_land_8_20_14_0_20_37_9]PIW98476.1 MAG: DUF2442 domain-containing protein [Ignavibacteria bacterium CG_4_8_14_3_um_filter_37_9]PIX95519.1 MAG: DUF2442 doma